MNIIRFLSVIIYIVYYCIVIIIGEIEGHSNTICSLEFLISNATLIQPKLVLLEYRKTSIIISQFHAGESSSLLIKQHQYITKLKDKNKNSPLVLAYIPSKCMYF